MTPAERRDPTLINGSRRLRIAKGSGTTTQDVNALLKQFKQVQQMMRSMAGGGKGKKGGVPPAGSRPARSPGAVVAVARLAAVPATLVRSAEQPERKLTVAVKIRLMRVGKKKQPTYRVVVADAPLAPRRPLHRDPRPVRAPRRAVARRVDDEKALDWLRKGAQPTEQVASCS